MALNNLLAARGFEAWREGVPLDPETVEAVEAQINERPSGLQ